MRAVITTPNQAGMVTDESVVTVGDGGWARACRLFNRAHTGGLLAAARIAETLRAMGWTIVPDTMATHDGCVTCEVEAVGRDGKSQPRWSELEDIPLGEPVAFTIRVQVRAPAPGATGSLHHEVADHLCKVLAGLGPYQVGTFEPTVWHIVRVDNDMRG